MTDTATNSEAASPEGARARDVRSVAAELGARYAPNTDEVRRRVNEGASAARDWAADQSDVIRDTVQTKPFISVGVSAASAFAAGLVLGVLLTRR